MQFSNLTVMCVIIHSALLTVLLLSLTATITSIQTFICFAMYFWWIILIDYVVVCIDIQLSVIFHVFLFLLFFFFFFFFPVMLYYSYTLTFSLVWQHCCYVVVCRFVRSLMALVCQEIKGLLTYLLTLWWQQTHSSTVNCALDNCRNQCFFCKTIFSGTHILIFVWRPQYSTSLRQ